jgi:hypothetical protein
LSAGRKAIRAHVVGLLMGETSAETRVFANRAAPVHAGAELPAIVVWADREEAQKEEEAPLVWRRKLEVRVEVIARALGHPAVAPTGGATVSLADVLDDLCEEVEQILFKQPRFWGLDSLASPGFIQDLVFRGVEVEIREDGASLLGSAALTWEVSYDVEDGPDPAELPNLTKVHVDYDLPDGEPVDAADDIEL